MKKKTLISAHGYDKLNNESRIFWSIECWSENSVEILTARLKVLIDKKGELNTTSPQIPDWAYRKAKSGIAEGEASFQVDNPKANSFPGLPFSTRANVVPEEPQSDD